MEQIEIATESIKLDSFLKYCGAAGTGGEAKQRVAEGAVSVNGEICTARGRKLRDGDTVVLEGTSYTVKRV